MKADKLEAMAKTSSRIRQVAYNAKELGLKLDKLNAGPVFDREGDQMIRDIILHYNYIKEFMEEVIG